MDELFRQPHWCPICKVGCRVNAIGTYMGVRYYYLACGHHADTFGHAVYVGETG